MENGKVHVASMSGLSMPHMNEMLEK
uniref:Unknown protein 7 (Fragments) n=1 Tax=Pseudotsuga menziesii TaxID=3357 RepID=UP07_PSEMZ|nr:RecName: Full=Unknown protein 7 [Pseudotsuga menziesii]